MTDIELYFENFRLEQEEKRLSIFTDLIMRQFPDINGLLVTTSSVYYHDERYTLEEVTEFIMNLYQPK